MKITKLKAGNRIHCSDSELEALRCLTELAVPLVRGEDAKRNTEHLSSMAKAAIRSERFTAPGGPLAFIDEKRRP